MFQKASLDHYKETRNGMIGSEYSSKFSAWLANGTISPRYVYHQVRDFESENGPSPSTKSFVDELFWREWCRWWCLKHGNAVFYANGVFDRPDKWKRDKEKVRRWKEG